ncbi:hypothetical protein VIGAN_08066400 [Vigna angularis var. angularis]|uniref:Uncharacterized protein n=1 Tax=Vigna angularis var. angularis TaxID=157739 RepID=A0A0S3SMM8_PHAAN|nr:hypothetical protein VIGAN_08066400 [Vigna angularis var. angularis]
MVSRVESMVSRVEPMKLDKFRLSNLIEISLYVVDSLVEDNGPKEYPVPTEEDYNNYISTPPTSPSPKKNEVHPKLVAEDEPKLEAEDEPNHDL